MTIKRFEEIEAWQDARVLNKNIYVVTQSGEFSKDWTLRDQIRRAAGSSMHNIPEGFDSGSTNEFIRFLRYSKRSCSEVQSQLYVALDLGYIGKEKFDLLFELAAKTRAKVGAFIGYLERTGQSRE